jgi:phosphatidylserine decarboxylase
MRPSPGAWSRHTASTALTTRMRRRKAKTRAGSTIRKATTAVAARAIIVIDADDASIGEIACVFVGMAEVSSCQVTIRPGQRVAKSDELGFFQYGGSTFCLLFRAGVIETFCPKPPYHDDVPPLHVNAHLATAR